MPELGDANLDCTCWDWEMSKTETTPERVRIVIHFADGQKLETSIAAEEGAFNFRVQSDCPAVTNVFIAVPGSKMEVEDV
jgi:hypothetical protein